MVTILDAHPDLAMSYEIYEDRLLNVAGDPMQLDWILREFAESRPADDAPVAWIKGVGDKNLQTFFFRARRAGLEVTDVIREIETHQAGGGTLDTLTGRLDLIERLMKRKMKQAGKRLKKLRTSCGNMSSSDSSSDDSSDSDDGGGGDGQGGIRRGAAAAADRTHALA